jgi:hypothetical protein
MKSSIRLAFIFRVFDCLLLLLGAIYIIVCFWADQIGKVGDYEYWVLGTVLGICACQLVILVFRGKHRKVFAFAIGFSLVPMCIVSCVMGYFYFFHYADVNIFRYRETAMLIFLEANLLYLVISSMVYIYQATGPSISSYIE